MFLVIFLVFTNLWAIEPTSYESKPDFKANSEVVGSQIFFKYGFKDLKGSQKEWSWQDDYSKLNSLSSQFGIYVKDPANPSYSSKDQLPEFFEKHPLAGITPNYNKLIAYYQDTVLEIYRNWSQEVSRQQLNRRESIELLLRFFQDYPYGIPPRVVGQKYIAGFLVPPLALEKGWADCDSKSLLMATVLSFDSYFRDKMAMILVPGHALLGIELTPQPYDETYEYRNRTFVVAEPTGLSRTPLGRRNSPYASLIAIIPLAGPARSVVIETSSTIANGLKPLTEADCPDQGLLVEYFSNTEKAKIQVCMQKNGSDFIKHGPLLKYDPSGQPREKEIYNQGKKI